MIKSEGLLNDGVYQKTLLPLLQLDEDLLENDEVDHLDLDKAIRQAL